MANCLYSSFTGQAPIVLVCFCLAAWQLPSHSLSRPKLQSSLDNSESTSLLRHLDILGTVAFAASTITFLLLLNLGGQKLPWGHPIVLLLAISCLMLSLGFLAIEWHTREPLIPPWLLTTNGVGVFCLVQILLFVSRWAVRTILLLLMLCGLIVEMPDSIKFITLLYPNRECKCCCCCCSYCANKHR